MTDYTALKAFQSSRSIVWPSPSFWPPKFPNLELLRSLQIAYSDVSVTNMWSFIDARSPYLTVSYISDGFLFISFPATRQYNWSSSYNFFQICVNVITIWQLPYTNSAERLQGKVSFVKLGSPFWLTPLTSIVIMRSAIITVPVVHIRGLWSYQVPTGTVSEGPQVLHFFTV